MQLVLENGDFVLQLLFYFIGDVRHWTFVGREDGLRRGQYGLVFLLSKYRGFARMAANDTGSAPEGKTRWRGRLVSGLGPRTLQVGLVGSRDGPKSDAQPVPAIDGGNRQCQVSEFIGLELAFGRLIHIVRHISISD